MLHRPGKRQRMQVLGQVRNGVLSVCATGFASGTLHSRRDGLATVGRAARGRQGVSLLEVLFSIGIIAVGLLGVMILVPAAAMRAKQGTIIDEADRFGRNAIRQFETGSMNHPEMWTRFNPLIAWNPAMQPNSPPFQQYGVPWPEPTQPQAGLLTSSYTYFWRPNINARWRARSFCIDPLMISAFVNDAISTGTPINPTTKPEVAIAVMHFPYVDPSLGGARMDRISLRTYPGSATGMSLDQAYHTFMGEDDLVFDLPDDRTLVPEQKFDSSVSKRQYEGKYTWIATMTPVLPTSAAAAAGSDYGYGDTSAELGVLPNTYLLSIIVSHRRDMSMTLFNDVTTSDEPDNERLVDVTPNTDGFPSQGIGGGEVQLRTRNGRPEQDLELKEGQWLMLSGTLNAGSAYPIDVFRWYRVMATDDVVPGAGASAGRFVRNVTLQGPDWNTALTTQATLLNNVVTVYEKTVQLEHTSMWTGW